MKQDRRDKALAIKFCLDSLTDDATQADLDDLARFISLAALAAEEAATEADPQMKRLKAMMVSDVGHC